MVRGLPNSRLKDSFDIYILSTLFAFDLETVSRAVRDTFSRRRTMIPGGLPDGLTQAFVNESGKRMPWRSFLNRSGAHDIPEDLAEIVASIAPFVRPIIEQAREDGASVSHWPPGGPWR